ncbi:MAG: endonuclease [Gemmobacter sp.]|nr:endonuclease [Gemmobacter sp.]
MIRQCLSPLPAPPLAERRALLSLNRDLATHDRQLAALPCMTAIETGGAGGTALSFPLTVAAWNVERCLFPEASASLLRDTGAALVLLSEMDSGMSRTAQRHTTAEMAGHLGMSWAYGVEFLELSLGSESERAFCSDAENLRGFHGNALMSQGNLSDPFLIRLPGLRHWFLQATDQPRLGERMAIGARIDTAQGPFIAVSTHLESVADAAQRSAQMQHIMDEIEAGFPGLPVLIGGDLNTGNHIGGDWRAETLFDQARARGFAVHGGPENLMTTRPSLITRWPDRAMKLDWFLTRGLRVSASAILPALDSDAQPLSDHDPILCRIEGFEAS